MVIVPPVVVSVVRIVKRRVLLLYQLILQVWLELWRLFGGKNFVGRAVRMTGGNSAGKLSPSACEPVFETDDAMGK